MKISIITSVYNNCETIEESIKSVINQTYKDIEYIVIDGGSNDGTLDIIKEYQKQISTFVSEEDKGIYDGLNKGVSLATGEIIAFLHSDDIYANDNIVQKVADEFLQDSLLDGVYGDLIYTTKDDTSKILRYWKSRDFYSGLLYKGWMPAHPTFFIKRKIYEKYGKFDLAFKISADYDFMLRILKDDIRVKYLSEVLYKMRVGGKSNKSLKNIIVKSKEDYRALKKNEIGGFWSLCLKNFSKFRQFFIH